MKSSISLFFLLLWSLTANSSDSQFLFNHQLLNAEGRSVKQMPDGSFYFIGHADDTLGNTNLILTKLDKDGNILWWKIYGDSTINIAHFINTTSSGDLIIAGERIVGGNADFEILLLDTGGSIIWERHYGTSKSESLHHIVATSDNGFLACGSITQPNLTANDFLVVKFDSLGYISWQREYGTPKNDVAMMLKITDSGKVIISGDTNDGSDVDNLLVFIDSAGNEIWQRQLGDANANGNQSIIINHEGNFILCGESTTAGNFLFDIYLASYDTAGNFLWSKYVGGDGSEAGFSISENQNHEYFITGYSTSIYTGAPYTAYLLKLDSSFHPVGLKYFPQPNLSICYEGILLTDSTLALSGVSGADFYFVLASDSGYTGNFTEHDFVSAGEDELSQNLLAKVYLLDRNNLQAEVSAEDESAKNRLVLYDITGRIISSHQFTNKITVDLSSLSAGVFFWCITSTEKCAATGGLYKP